MKRLMPLWCFGLYLSVRKEFSEWMPFSYTGSLSTSREFIQHLLNNYFNSYGVNESETQSKSTWMKAFYGLFKVPENTVFNNNAVVFWENDEKHRVVKSINYSCINWSGQAIGYLLLLSYFWHGSVNKSSSSMLWFWCSAQSKIGSFEGDIISDFSVAPLIWGL